MVRAPRGKLFRLALLATLAIDVACRRAPPPPPTGTWEGEIANPRRPYVFTVDFSAGRAQLAAGAPVAGRTDAVNTDDDKVSFELRLDSETWRFEGVRRDQALDGDITTPDGRIPFWLAQLPPPSPPADRAEAWRQDLDAVLARFLRYERSYTPAQREAVRARLERLRGAAAAMTDPQLMIELARAVALGGNAHTRLYLMRNRTELRRLPIRVWWFRDQLRVVRAAAPYRDLVGCCVIDVDGTPVAAAAERLAGIKAGNPSWQRYMSSYFLTSPEALSAVGVAREADRATLGLVCEQGRRELSLVAPPLRRQTSPVEAWWDLAPSYPHADTSFASALPLDRAPRYLRNAVKSYWFEVVPGDDILYVQLNRAQAMPSDPMPDFVARLVHTVEDRRPRAFVVDVRFNTGGDLTVATPLVEKLSAVLRGVPVFVLTGRATFSAGITHAAQWKQLAGAVVIGEPVGDELDTWSEGGNLVLPNSGLTVHYSNGFHAYSKQPYPDREPVFDLDIDSLAPAEVVEPSWADYMAGVDPLYEAVRRWIAKPRLEPRAAAADDPR